MENSSSLDEDYTDPSLNQGLFEKGKWFVVF